MTGLIEHILSQQFGIPTTSNFDGITARTWNIDDEPRRCKLYVGRELDPLLRSKHEHLLPLYGDSFGGVLLRDSLKISTLVPQDVWGLCRIDTLNSRPEVQRALLLNPFVDYFMDAANVWYYGHKGGELYCYDAQNDEVQDLGAVELAITDVISQWVEAIKC